MNAKSSLRSCFITASSATEVDSLRGVFEQHHVEVIDTALLQPRQSSLPSTIDMAIRRADFICALISTRTPPNIFFEIGLAYGHQKPLFIIVERDAELPDFLRQAFYVKASSHDTEAISFNLDTFLTKNRGKRTRKVSPPSQAKEQETPPQAVYDHFLSLIQYSTNESELQRLIADMLVKTDIVAAQEHGLHERGVDMAVWLNSLEPSISNPVLVEVKAGHLSQRQLEIAEEQLRNHADKTKVQIGLLLYRDSEGRRFPKASSDWPPIVRLDVRDFADLLSRNALVSRLIEERNNAVHGRD